MPEPHTWSIRPATGADCDALLAWRNDPTDFQWYLEASAVRADEHRAWLSERLERDHPTLWILDVDGEPGGSVRLDPDAGGSAFASIVVDPEYRGHGFGRALLAHLDEQSRSLGFVELRAVIHPENVASQALFTSAGYVQQSSTEDGFVSFSKALTTG